METEGKENGIFFTLVNLFDTNSNRSLCSCISLVNTFFITPN